MKIDQVNTSFQQSTQTENKIKNHQADVPEGLMDACREFEAYFLNTMLKQMRATVPDGGLTEKSMARDIFESMYDEQLSIEMAKGQGIGLAKDLYRQLARPYTAANIKQVSEE